jgi:hypothetical protein
MGLIEEYKSSLKMPEAEEILDLVFYRPVAFGFVKTIGHLPVTPNLITVLSLFCGLLAGWDFSIAAHDTLMWGAFWFAAANILDCSDGQLARLQQSGTLMGRVLDGVVDYITGIAIFVGIGIGLAANGHNLWWLVIAAGLSSAVHAVFFDYYQNEFMSAVRAERNFLDREVERFHGEIVRMKEERRDGLKVFFLNIYVRYLAFQNKASTKRQSVNVDPETYRTENRTMIRLWSFLGPTTNRTVLIVCAVLGMVQEYLWAVITLGNIWFLLTFILQRRIHRRVAALNPE